LILEDYVAGLLSAVLDTHAPVKVHPDQWDVKTLDTVLREQFGLDMEAVGIDPAVLGRHELGDAIFTALQASYDQKEKILSAPTMRYHERMVMFSVLDGLWKDHLLGMDHLKEGIGLRGYAQQDPLVAYKRESFDMFEDMMKRFQEDTVRTLFRMQIIGPDGKPLQLAPLPRPALPEVRLNLNGDSASEPANGAAPMRHDSKAETTIDRIEQEFQRKKKQEMQSARMAGDSAGATVTQRRAGEKVGRNDPCPCGSGKKFKKCHGVQA
jgi:preprotein translocase subunit SecA